VGGAPGTIVRGARYWWKPETNDYDGYWIDPEGDDIESITDIEMAMRRWIASRVALELRGSIESMRTPADVCRHLDAHRRIAISAEDMSEDAEQAIRGLLATHNSGEPGVPGFTGPDSAFSR
jgi:hypothetical protein